MKLWNQDGTLNADAFVERVGNIRNMKDSLDLLDKLADDIDFNPEMFNASSVNAFIRAAREVAGKKETSLELHCWSLIDKLDAREVRLIQEGQGKKNFSVGSDEVISLLKVSADDTLKLVDRDRPIEVAAACLCRHPDYVYAVVSAIAESTFCSGDECAILLTPLCRKMQEQGNADPRQSLIDLACKPSPIPHKVG